MKKRELSPKELQKVVELRQFGAKWTEIEHETKVERRAAKRAYEDWEMDQQKRKQEAARFRVAAEAFHEHLNDLIRLAEALTNHLSLPSGPDDTRSAEQHLSDLWQTSILEESKPYARYQADRNRQIQSTERLNLMIFKSLQDHTYEKVRWEALGEWQKAWDTCSEDCIKLREEAFDMLRNILNQKPPRQEPTLMDRLVKGSRKQDLLERMVDGVLYVIWRAILYQEPLLVQTMPCDSERTEITFGKPSLSRSLIFTEVDLAEEAAETCRWIAENLSKGDTIKAVGKQVTIMQERIGELEEMLHPLKLRPQTLNTRCDLCPA